MIEITRVEIIAILVKNELGLVWKCYKNMFTNYILNIYIYVERGFGIK